jgi:hypothetical protein
MLSSSHARALRGVASHLLSISTPPVDGDDLAVELHHARIGALRRHSPR